MKLYKESPVGGKGGKIFDSGCNLSGVHKVRIHCGPFHHAGHNYPSSILRIFLEFKDASRSPNYCGFTYKASTFHTFEVDQGDKISNIEVWHDHYCVTGLQFSTVSGHISHLFGTPSESDNKANFPAEIDSKDGKKMVDLVGVHGSFGGLLDSVGFTFGHVVAKESQSSTLSVNDASIQNGEETGASCEYEVVTDDWNS
jgi:hypothetical protein